MSSSTPDSASLAADQVRRLAYLHDAVELYSRSSPALAAWYGLQFVERAHDDGIALNDAVTKTICTKCGSLLVPAVTRSVEMRGKGKGLTVQQECCRCKQRVVVQGKVAKSDRKRVAVVGNASGSGAKTKAVGAGKATTGKVAKLSKAESVPVSTSKSGSGAKVPTVVSKQQVPTGSKGKGRGKAVEQNVVQDDDSASRRSMSKKKSTLRGLLSLQKKNEADSKSLSLNDFLSNL
ncbi:hypothetical protein BCR44DRAFT_51143 [Catenaria anguillulae PL171]|uniref:RNAse P Rpr2/Rpp21/SNM1 subunit domain-domain-containing protein n=1 Tax=Catenaria anguillulae PL171 TaxID=765915 RepID=A0A1Y2I4V6_9FUNG|nr:hypothetical protein BCR44DRAFT_51143 [Catenaria anguillulae PL171]